MKGRESEFPDDKMHPLSRRRKCLEIHAMHPDHAKKYDPPPLFYMIIIIEILELFGKSMPPSPESYMYICGVSNPAGIVFTSCGSCAGEE